MSCLKLKEKTQIINLSWKNQTIGRKIARDREMFLFHWRALYKFAYFRHSPTLLLLFANLNLNLFAVFHLSHTPYTTYLPCCLLQNSQQPQQQLGRMVDLNANSTGFLFQWQPKVERKIIENQSHKIETNKNSLKLTK